MGKTIVLICLIWTSVIGGSYVWNYSEASKLRSEIALQTARGFIDLVLMTRKWNSEHGGVYVPVTANTKPNPYLDVPMRDIKINSGLTLTKINPAYMTRQISEITAAQKGIRFHLTSLNPHRPENRPTPLEMEALRAFEEGGKEVGQFIKGDGGPVFFYMSPVIAGKSCLGCHAKQGYKEGEIRGGISVTFPFTPRVPFMTIALGHIGIGLAGLIGFMLFGFKLDRYYEMLRNQSFIDSLTGIPNRRGFTDTIQRAFGHARRTKLPLSLIMCDVDKFKDYNDNYGHSAGDVCLKKVARAIEMVLHRPDDYCARFGGEEFVIVLQDSTEEGARLIAEKIRATVEAMGLVHATAGPLKVVTISLGLATYAGDKSISSDALIEQADKALYAAKKKGRNRVEVFRMC